MRVRESPVMPSLLLIDTDPSFIYLVARYGQMCGCTVTTARTLDEALATAKNGSKDAAPALIVLHLTPPPQGAFAVVRALKADEVTAQIPLLLCGSSNDAAGAWEAGADHWLSKPVMFDDFRAVLHSVGIAMGSEAG